MIKIIAVSRGEKYSPNHIGNDAAIFKKVVEHLRALECEVEVFTESDFVALPLPQGGEEVTVVDMARDAVTIARLHEWERAGVLVINSPRGIDNCVRRPMTERLLAQGVSHPRSWIVEMDDRESAIHTLAYPCWIKRGDSHAVVKEDVCYVATPEEAARVFGEFVRRGIPSAVVNEHLQGDLVKFYGVQDCPFFHWFYPSSDSHSKFGLEAINGAAVGLSFDECVLKQCADEAARVLDVPVYGGDAVVSADGSVRLIDFNDWPSFAPCREEAAPAIARYVVKAVKKQQIEKTTKQYVG